jgi:hypothetical protein
MLFMVAAMAAEMERDLIRERTLNGLRVTWPTAAAAAGPPLSAMKCWLSPAPAASAVSR